MAEQEPHQKNHTQEEEEDEPNNLTCSYICLSFYLFLALLPKNIVLFVQNLQSQLKDLSERVRQIRLTRKEDSEANVRVVEILAAHWNDWLAEKKRLFGLTVAASQEIARLSLRVLEFEKVEAESKARLKALERDVRERDGMIRSLWKRDEKELSGSFSRDYGGGNSREWSGFDPEFLASAYKFWEDNASLFKVCPIFSCIS